MSSFFSGIVPYNLVFSGTITCICSWAAASYSANDKGAYSS